METCTAEFARLAIHAPLLRCDANPFLTLHNPFGLQNWTFPVVELLLTAGATACLFHGICWYRRYRDASNLVVWASLIVALLLIEPITYFPQWFGLQNTMGLTFIHGQFSIQFLYDRLPLYIVAMYPVYGYLAYVLVQRTGILKRYDSFVSSVCVAFLFMCLFEVVDTVGPQWGWWVWNQQLPTSKPSMGPIPYLSLQGFSLVMPFAIALLTRWVSGKPAQGGWRLIRNIVIVSVGVWPLFLLMNLPATILELAGFSTMTARGITVWTLIIGGFTITAWAFYGSLRARMADPTIVPVGARGDRFAAICVAVYLIFGVIFWAAALPGYFDAVDGVAPSGNPTGSLAFGVAAALLTVALTAIAYRGTASASSPMVNRVAPSGLGG
ncbi:hypothetical protein [Mycobacterium sp. 94-17]|uniref:hypothetical protein n=1 Tax=Mycobacterium sp. 94-17 TaxID=2986147 RepID=UPI002D1F3E7D|nr:hypothetical protein [Mycobacterium sp. 94-17]MEB4209536.1 hypothetical protein [Mycobacterium sp. 94-17]